MMTLENLLHEIRTLPVKDRKRLIGLIVDTLAEAGSSTKEVHDILEFEGVGAELWKDTDAQEYVDHLRDEWETKRED